MSPKTSYVLDREVQTGKEGKVPALLSDFMSVELLLSVGFVLPFPFFLENSIDLVGFILLLPFAVLICLVALGILHLFQRRRYRIVCRDQEILSVIAQAARRLGYQKDFEVWVLPTKAQVLVPLSTLTSRAIVLSEGTIEDILARPEDGEIVLANTIGGLDHNFFVHVKIPVVLSILFSLYSLWWCLSMVEPKVVLIYLIFFFLIPAQGVAIIRGNKIPDNPVFRTYQTHPDIAQIRVFRGGEPTEEERARTIDRIPGTRPPDPHKRETLIVFVLSITTALLVGYAADLFLFSQLVLPPPFVEPQDFWSFLVFLLLFEGLFIGYSVYMRGPDKEGST